MKEAGKDKVSSEFISCFSRMDLNQLMVLSVHAGRVDAAAKGYQLFIKEFLYDLYCFVYKCRIGNFAVLWPLNEMIMVSAESAPSIFLWPVRPPACPDTGFPASVGLRFSLPGCRKPFLL